MARSQRESISLSLRFHILRRDKYTCQYCGAKAPDAALHIDHVIPVVDGGNNKPENLIAACVRCNLGKGTKPDKSDDERPHTERERQLGTYYEWFLAHHNIWAWAADVYCGEDPNVRLLLFGLASRSDPNGGVILEVEDIFRRLHLPQAKGESLLRGLLRVGLVEEFENPYSTPDLWLYLPWVSREGDEHIPVRKLKTYGNFLSAEMVYA